MAKDLWFDLPVIGALPPGAAANKLEELGESELAATLRAAPLEAEYREQLDGVGHSERKRGRILHTRSAM